MPVRIEKDDIVRMLNNSSNATEIAAQVTGLWDNGQSFTFPITDVAGTTRANALADSARAPLSGFIHNAEVVALSAAKRGQTYVNLHLLRNNLAVGTLCTGYVGSNLPLPLGKIDGPGPGDGEGFMRYRAIADDIAPADIESTLAATNALRRIDGFVWYYHCSSDVASRTLRVSLRDVGNGLPTGMTSGGNTLVGVWPSAAVLTLTQDQEGTMLVHAVEGKIGFAVSNDNGAVTFEDPTTNPDPFPLWIQEDDVAELFFDVTNEEAADRHTIYIIEEEWIWP